MSPRGTSPIHTVTHRISQGGALYERRQQPAPVARPVSLPAISIAALPIDREDYFLGHTMQKRARACGVLPPEIQGDEE